MGKLSQRKEIISEWKAFLRQWTLGKNHYGYSCLLINSLSIRPMPPGQYQLDPIAEFLMPLLLYVRMVTVLDNALRAYMSIHGIKLDKKYKDGLHGRINTLNNRHLLLKFSDLDRIRINRNEIAHQNNHKKFSYDELTIDLNIIEKELQHLKMIGDRPNYQPDFSCTLGKDWKLSIKENGKESIFAEWTNKYDLHQSETAIIPSPSA